MDTKRIVNMVVDSLQRGLQRNSYETLLIGDVHGDLIQFLSPLMSYFNVYDYEQSTNTIKMSLKKSLTIHQIPTIVYLGDIFDRGLYGELIGSTLVELIKNYNKKIIWLLGNHDMMYLDKHSINDPLTRSIKKLIKKKRIKICITVGSYIVSHTVFSQSSIDQLTRLLNYKPISIHTTSNETLMKSVNKMIRELVDKGYNSLGHLLVVNNRDETNISKRFIIGHSSGITISIDRSVKEIYYNILTNDVFDEYSITGTHKILTKMTHQKYEECVTNKSRLESLNSKLVHIDFACSYGMNDYMNSIDSCIVGVSTPDYCIFNGISLEVSNLPVYVCYEDSIRVFSKNQILEVIHDNIIVNYYSRRMSSPTIYIDKVYTDQVTLSSTCLIESTRNRLMCSYILLIVLLISTVVRICYKNSRYSLFINTFNRIHSHLQQES